MTDEHVMIDRLLAVAKLLDGQPPYEKRDLSVTLGDIAMLSKGIELLAAVRAAQKS